MIMNKYHKKYYKKDGDVLSISLVDGYRNLVVRGKVKLDGFIKDERGDGAGNTIIWSVGAIVITIAIVVSIYRPIMLDIADSLMDHAQDFVDNHIDKIFSDTV